MRRELQKLLMTTRREAKCKWQPFTLRLTGRAAALATKSPYFALDTIVECRATKAQLVLVGAACSQ